MSPCPETEERIVVSAPAGARLALERAAILARIAPGALARRFVIDGLRASGYDLPEDVVGGH